ncbi:AMP-binding protein, partial [bacterium AH-315-C08]|nr:AMP-binding protein [bacterium AH-315-C08]
MFGFEISEGLKQKLDSFCKEQKPFPVFLATLQALLFRYTSQKEIAVFTRTAPGFSSPKLVQYLSNLDDSLTFKQLLDAAKESEMDSTDPGKILLEALETKDPGRTPLYSVILNVESALSEKNVLPDDLDSSEPVLVIDLKEKEKYFQGEIGCSIELFDADLLPRFADHFVNLLQSGINDPEQTVSDLTLLSKDEYEKRVNNGIEANTPGDGIIHHWIESVAKENPQSPAVELAGKTLTYSELDSRANRLANYLRTVNVGPDCCVGIFMSRSFDSMIGILAILKAGGAYVPLDPAYPDERLQAIWREMDSPILLTQSDLKDKIDAGDVKALCLDTDWQEIEEFSADPPQVKLKPENLSYVIFTSGSTGKPKGILLTHAGLSNLTHASNRFFYVH